MINGEQPIDILVKGSKKRLALQASGTKGESEDH